MILVISAILIALAVMVSVCGGINYAYHRLKLKVNNFGR